MCAAVLTGAAAGQASGAGHSSSAQLDPLGGDSIAQVTLALTAIVALIVVAAWVMRRLTRTQFSRGGQFKVLGAMPIGPRERLVLVQVGDQQLLLGVSPGRISSLQTLDRPLALDAPMPQPMNANPATGAQAASFAGTLARALGSR